MPELPEVETIKRGLSKYLIGHFIEKVDIQLRKQFTGDERILLGKEISNVRRVGKVLLIDFANTYSLAIHVKMTGQLVYRGNDVPERFITSDGKVGKLPNKYTHITITLDRGGSLYYNDVRQFGWIRLIKTDQISEFPYFQSLGPEPLSTLTLAIFHEMISHAKTAIKPFLMDQKNISGIGNIYANDSLFLAKILPSRPAKSLSVQEQTTLFNAICTVLKKGITEGGSSENNYVNALGEAGNYQNYTLIYGKNNSTCMVCGTIIKKTQLAGRGTFFCATCQK